MHAEQAAAPDSGPFAFVRRYSGIMAMMGSSMLWGSLPLYWRLLDDVPAELIFCHRVLWSFVFLVPLTILLGGWKAAMAAVRNWRVFRIMILSSLFLAVNWLLYIWAVNEGRVLETSLGYYILPLLNVAMGILFFGDKPRRAQYIAIGLAFIGVAAQIVMTGYVPWVALGLGFSFMIYGILRKIIPVESLPGLFVETSILVIPALIAVLLSVKDGFPFLNGSHTGRDMLLIGAGVATTLPLLLFAHGVRRIPLVTVGIMQYFSPTITLIIGVFVFGESFSFAQGLAFGCIWLALVLYSIDGIRAHGKAKPSASGGEASAATLQAKGLEKGR
ncbi:EamA family transporter RarD [Desulfovibrio sp. OttesenSCG-928-I05]|nr:EamA family transporter RarD [Desulfovibrio sp. OttesenSCG-928-I05]